jgi:hypothetical protein
VSDQVEPGQEVSEFIQEITSFKQSAPSRFVGALQNPSSSSPQRDYRQDLEEFGDSLIPGEPIHTEVWARKNPDGVWETSGNPRKPPETKGDFPNLRGVRGEMGEKGFQLFTAEWKYPTVGLWKRLGYKRQNPFDQERKIWEVFLLQSNLAEGEPPSARLSESILKSRRGFIASLLARQFLHTTILSQRETVRIERECMILWRGKGAPVRNPHPGLEEVVTAMGLNERFGLPTWTCVDEIHVKTYAIIKKVLECYSNAMNMNAAEDDVRHRVGQIVGIPRPRLVGA